MELVRQFVAQVREDDAFRVATPREQVNEALRLVDLNGRRFWGTFGMYTRRRTVLDSYLMYKYPAHFG